jgi:hypothetical protein
MTSMPRLITASGSVRTRWLHTGQIVPPSPSPHPARICQPEALQ